jgi:hypothetical protein
MDSLHLVISHHRKIENSFSASKTQTWNTNSRTFAALRLVDDFVQVEQLVPDVVQRSVGDVGDERFVPLLV